MSFSGLKPGYVIDERFELARPLGAGTFGEVWVALDRDQGRRELALKLLRPHLGNRPSVVKRFVQEIEVLQRLEHPNVVRPIHARTDGPHMYMALELIPGQTLKEEMEGRARSGVPYTFDEIASRIEGMAAALDAAHAASVVHRDLKPSNVMVWHEDDVLRISVLDFGIAKLDVTASERTTAGRMLGTLMYMAPEQLRGQDVDERADIFALGVIGFELLTLRRLFARDEQSGLRPVASGSVPAEAPNLGPDVIRRIVFEKRPTPSAHRPEISASADAVLASCLEAQVDRRPKSAMSFSQDLKVALFAPPDDLVDERKRRARAETAFAEPSEPSAEASHDLPPTAISPSPLTPEGRVSELTPTPAEPLVATKLEVISPKASLPPAAITVPDTQRTVPDRPKASDNRLTVPDQPSETVALPTKDKQPTAKVPPYGWIAAILVSFAAGALIFGGSGEPSPVKTATPVAPPRAVGAVARPSEPPPSAPIEQPPEKPAAKGTKPPPTKPKPRSAPPKSAPPRHIGVPSSVVLRFDRTEARSIKKAAARLERLAGKLADPAKSSIQRCAALVSVSRSAKELDACISKYYEATGEPDPR